MSESEMPSSAGISFCPILTSTVGEKCLNAIPSVKKSEISLVHPRNFNDPFDPILISWLDNIIRKRENAKKQDQQTKDELETYCLLRKACELLRMRCMVKASDNEKENKIENINPLMWAHYASCHTGFCAEYRITDTDLQRYNSNCKFLKLVPVSYKKDKIMDSSHIELTRALTYKDPIWEYEKEYRLIYFDTEETDANVANVENFSPEAIYLGFKCTGHLRLHNPQLIQSTSFVSSTEFKNIDLISFVITELRFSNVIPLINPLIIT